MANERGLVLKGHGAKDDQAPGRHHFPGYQTKPMQRNLRLVSLFMENMQKDTKYKAFRLAFLLFFGGSWPCGLKSKGGRDKKSSRGSYVHFLNVDPLSKVCTRDSGSSRGQGYARKRRRCLGSKLKTEDVAILRPRETQTGQDGRS